MSEAPIWRHDYFQSMYGAAEDPYGVRSRWYEQRKRAVLLASLPRKRFERAFEPACGIGELTTQLAARCNFVLASDFNQAALATARTATAELRNVRIERQVLPREWPTDERPFDLIVVSEVGYFLSHSELDEFARRCLQALSPDGALVACHWQSNFSERTVQTPLVHKTLGNGLRDLVVHAEADFLLNVWTCDGKSVAKQEGIV